MFLHSLYSIVTGADMLRRGIMTMIPKLSINTSNPKITLNIVRNEISPGIGIDCPFYVGVTKSMLSSIYCKMPQCRE